MNDPYNNDPYNLDETINVDFEPRCPIVLLVDVSNSMEGEPHRQLQAGLDAFANYLQEDSLSKRRVEVAVVTFGDTTLEAYDFVQAFEWLPPELTLRGTTPMGQAIRHGLDILEDRTAFYLREGRPHYRPWMLLITDGAPTDEYISASDRLKQAQDERKLHFYAIGVNDADLEILNSLSRRSAKKLTGLNFGNLFRWVSQGLIAVSHSGSGDRVKMPVDDWSEIDA